MKTFLLFIALPLAALATDTFTMDTVNEAGLQAAFAKLVPGGKIIPAPEQCERAVIRYEALPEIQKRMFKTLSTRYGVRIERAGEVVAWDTRFDCVAYALAFNLELRSALFREYWMAKSPARRPACVMAEYKPDRAKDSEIKGHAVLFLVTDAGPMFWDPITGRVQLSADEIKTLYFFTP